MHYAIHAISTGKIEDLQYGNDRPMKSAMNKQPIQEKMWLSRTGFVEDEQAYHGHGGPDKAVCLYSRANYMMWQKAIRPLPEYAMFGENITVCDIDETELFFGDQYRLGEAIIEVSEIREPCWKIQSKYGYPSLVKEMSKTGKTGCYFRVIKEGFVKPNAVLSLFRSAPKATRLSVQSLNDLYYNDRKNQARLTYALQNPYLTNKRKETLKKMLQQCTTQ
ncbi:MOSC domain-containing protein [Staphylococcus lutrae]|uniref:MOSC domain-containing protein n=1 Tax=Staphylococcus lutrae TaxID=155085 RepID=A0AAC9WJ60_9STAP|nr:MOSC domain-containing protein [Staphylococcus lutrae]ARJ50491.1 MOSC domain-containing protein [Staphylococcus lutrae]PNZ38219.1 MOSC domain-containing protein [Staphylococcus lutrae]HEC2184691.1 MOSC domain-containing protein [Staphylococcus delphini]